MSKLLNDPRVIYIASILAELKPSPWVSSESEVKLTSVPNRFVYFTYHGADDIKENFVMFDLKDNEVRGRRKGRYNWKRLDFRDDKAVRLSLAEVLRGMFDE